MRLGGAHSALYYVLGAPITTETHGSAQVSSLWMKYPFLRTRDANLNGQMQYDGLTLRDYYSSANQSDRSLSKWTLSLNGDTRDEWIAGGINSWRLDWTTGQVSFDNAAAQLVDEAAANSLGAFSKWNASFIRLQSLTPSAMLYLTALGQWTGKNLDPSQKMSVGGPYTVRAYDMGAISGDSGYFLSAEYRYNLPRVRTGQWQFVAFMDRANVTFNSKTWPKVTGENSGSLTGAGLGVNWSGADQWSAKAYLATPIGSAPALVDSIQSTRVWVELNRKF
jgi:hemolysin activation/secretion protein